MKTIIGPRTAIVLYALLLVLALALLHGQARYFALIVILGIAAKSFVGFLRNRAQ